MGFWGLLIAGKFSIQDPTRTEACGYPKPKTSDPKPQSKSAISRLPETHTEDD